MELTDIAVIRRLCAAHGFSLSKGLGQNFIVNPGVCPKIVEASGIDETYGARPLRRTIQRTVEDALAEKLLEGNLKEGAEIAAVVEDGKVVLRVGDSAMQQLPEHERAPQLPEAEKKAETLAAESGREAEFLSVRTERLDQLQSLA